MSSMHHKQISAGDTVALTLRVALEHHDSGELHEAAALYREVLGMDAENAEALFLLSLIETASGNLHAAIRHLRAAVAAQPRSLQMHRALAETLLRAGNRAAALHVYWSLLSLEPANPLAYVTVADVMTQIKPDGGNDHSAAACYRRALALDAHCAGAHVGLGHVHGRAGDLVTAEVEYRAAIALDDRQPQAHTALAALFYRQQKYVMAADAYRRAILLQPGSPALLDCLGNALRQLGHRVRAEACYRRAEELRAVLNRAAKRPRTAKLDRTMHAEALVCASAAHPEPMAATPWEVVPAQ